MTNFHDIFFPRFLEPYVKRSSVFSTTCITSKSGREIRAQNVIGVKKNYSIKDCILSLSQFLELRDFFYARQGQMYGFLFSDSLDNRVDNEILQLEENRSNERSLYKVYKDTVCEFRRKIFTPDLDDFEVKINDLLIPNSSFVFQNGVIIFNNQLNTDDVVYVKCSFNTPARFSHDILEYKVQSDSSVLVDNIEIIEIDL